MSLFLLPDVFVFSGKGSDKDKPTLNRHTIPLTGFYRQKITAFRYWMHDDFL